MAAAGPGPEHDRVAEQPRIRRPSEGSQVQKQSGYSIEVAKNFGIDAQVLGHPDDGVL